MISPSYSMWVFRARCTSALSRGEAEPQAGRISESAATAFSTFLDFSLCFRDAPFWRVCPLAHHFGLLFVAFFPRSCFFFFWPAIYGRVQIGNRSRIFSVKFVLKLSMGASKTTRVHLEPPKIWEHLADHGYEECACRHDANCGALCSEAGAHEGQAGQEAEAGGAEGPAGVGDCGQ